MTKQAVLVNVSVFLMIAAMVAFIWSVIGASAAPNGQPGAFDFLRWPAVALAGISWAVLVMAKRIGKPQTK